MVLAFGCSHAIAMSTPEVCESGGSYMAFTWGRLDAIFTESDTGIVRLRDELGMQAVPPEQIAPVTDDAICRAARDAYAREMLRMNPNRVPSTDTTRKVRVFRVNQDYAVLDPSVRAGDYYILMFFNSDFSVWRGNVFQ